MQIYAKVTKGIGKARLMFLGRLWSPQVPFPSQCGGSCKSLIEACLVANRGQSLTPTRQGLLQQEPSQRLPMRRVDSKLALGDS